MVVSPEKRSAIFWMTTGWVFVLGIGAIDLLIGRELSLALFYLIPIVMVTWFLGRNYGLVISVLSAITWCVADGLAGQTYSHPAIRFWNAAMRLGFFVSVTWLLPALKALDREKELARVDYLTGAANRRFLFEVVQHEVDRSHRYEHPLAIAYLDLDDFKTVNDQWGHRVGDTILCAVVTRARAYLRKTDTIARVGGDEFILLFPETDHAAAQRLIPRIHKALGDEMHRNHWPVTFSIGVLTCRQASPTAEDLIRRVDEVMYSVKKNGKNGVAYAEYAGPPAQAPGPLRLAALGPPGGDAPR